MRSWGIGFNEWNAAVLYGTDLLILAVLGLWVLRLLINKKAPIGTTDFAVPIGAARNAESSGLSPDYILANSKSLSSSVINSKTLEGGGFAPPGSWMISRSQHYTPPRANLLYQRFDWFLIGFIIISAISVKNASNQMLGFYQLAKMAEFSLLYFYIKSNLGNIFNLIVSFFVLLASGFFQAILAILQYIRQADLGLRFLGETVLSPDLFNVAVFLADGEKVMRPYGTLPHPNVLAFFIFISVFIYYFFYIQKNKFLHSKIGLFIYSVLLFSLFLTFSRIIIFVWVIGAGLRWFIFNKKFSQISENLSLKNLILATLAVMVLFSVLFWPQVLARLQISLGEEVVSLRSFYNKLSLLEKPFFGVGLGNFVNWSKEVNPGLAANLYQPVHNIYLLIFSETGILGLSMFFLFLIFLLLKSFKFQVSSFIIIFLSLLFFGLFDHFLWTIQQGQIIFWIVLGLIATFARPATSP